MTLLHVRHQAQVDQAKLNLSYTRIVAPVAGIVNKKNVDIGDNLSTGQNLMNIVNDVAVDPKNGLLPLPH